MGLPDVAINIQDPGLGTIPASAGKTQVKLGVCQAAATNAILAFGSIAAAKAALGDGPMLDAVAQVLAVAGGPVMAVPVLPSSYGTVAGSLTLTGVGSGTIAAAKGPQQVLKVKIGTGGTLGTATFQVAVGAGAYGPVVTTGASGPWSYMVPGQAFSTAVFAAGTYVAGDIYTLNLDGTVTRTGSGTATLLNGSVHSPVDAYDIIVKVATTGGLGAGAFAYSLDGGHNYSGTIAIPSGGAYAIPNTGIVLTFSGTFTAGDLYEGVSTAAGFSNTDLTSAFTALLANPSEWGLAHVVGTPADAAAAATLAAAVGAQMAAAQAAFRYVRGVIECPTAEGDSTLKTTFQSYADSRVGVVAGDEDVLSPLTGRLHKRPLAWSYMARLSATKLSSHPGQVDTSNNGGPLKNVRAIYRDESATPGLDDARFVTSRTFIGTPGYFITRGKTMASPGSDFAQIMNCRVMDRACTVARAAFLLYVNKSIRIDKVTGFIDERDAQDIEAMVQSKLEGALVSEGECSAVSVAVSRDDNILATSTLNVQVGITPFGYAEQIVVSIGFVNPALAAAA